MEPMLQTDWGGVQMRVLLFLALFLVIFIFSSRQLPTIATISDDKLSTKNNKETTPSQSKGRNDWQNVEGAFGTCGHEHDTTVSMTSLKHPQFSSLYTSQVV